VYEEEVDETTSKELDEINEHVGEISRSNHYTKGTLRYLNYTGLPEYDDSA